MGDCEKVGHPITATGDAARKWFPETEPRFAIRMIHRAGGIERLKRMDPDARRVLLKQYNFPNRSQK
jgi:hypothetical protein